MFSIDQEQSEKIGIWMKEQNAKFKESGANGGVYSYIFTPTSLGLVVEVRNNVTKESINVTNYGDW
jgi:hypothetical protein